MYKQNNRFSRRSEGSIARNTMGNRIGKPLAGGKFHASRKSDVRKDDELEEKKAKAEKPVVRRILSSAVQSAVRPLVRHDETRGPRSRPITVAPIRQICGLISLKRLITIEE